MTDLRIMVCGQVDDGKSTLMGRLLIHSGQVFADQIDHITQASHDRNLHETKMAYVTDGLKYERDHGVTVDTAYRTLQLNHRRIQFIDCPGHTKYIAQLISGASFAAAAVVVVDITRKISEQLANQLQVLRFFKIQKILFCLNKIDLKNDELSGFDLKVTEIKNILKNIQLDPASIHFIPISALKSAQLFSRHPNLIQFPCLTEVISGWADAFEKVIMAAEDLFLFSVQAVIQKSNQVYLFGKNSGRDPDSDLPFYKINLNSKDTILSKPMALEKISNSVFMSTARFRRGDIILQAAGLNQLVVVKKLSCEVILFKNFDFDLLATYHFKNFYYDQSFKICNLNQRTILNYEFDLILDSEIIFVKDSPVLDLRYGSFYNSKSEKIGCVKILNYSVSDDGANSASKCKH